MLRIAERLTIPARDGATLTLSFEDRQNRRQRVTLDTGEAAALDLPRGTRLRDNDLLRAENGRVIAVRAATEAVSTVRNDPTLLARAAYHLGNRHVALEIGEGFVRYLEDHVLDTMVEALGLRIKRERPVRARNGCVWRRTRPSHEHG